MSQSASHPTEAQRTQIPPAIRKFAIQHCVCVERIERFSESNETHNRGFKIVADGATLSQLPDGYRFGNGTVTNDGKLRLQIREEF